MSRVISAAAVLGAASVIGGCGSSSSNTTLPLLVPDSGDRAVYTDVAGHGSRSLSLSEALGSPRPRRLTIDVVCIGGGEVTIKVAPGDEQATWTCGHGVGGGEDVVGPAKLPVPHTARVEAPSGTSWRVAVADPTGATGVGAVN